MSIDLSVEKQAEDWGVVLLVLKYLTPELDFQVTTILCTEYCGKKALLNQPTVSTSAVKLCFFLPSLNFWVYLYVASHSSAMSANKTLLEEWLILPLQLTISITSDRNHLKDSTLESLILSK